MADSVPSRTAANEVVDDFAAQLAELVSDDAATITRLREGNSDRGFLVVREKARVRFVAKISQSGTGFWGLGIDKAAEMIDSGQEHLVLLTAADEGYFVSATRLQHLAPKLSQSQGDYKIGETKVRKEQRFRDLEELWDLLQQRMVPE